MNKKEVIKELQEYFEDKFNIVSKDTKIDMKDRLEAADIYWNIKKVLDNYDENIDILNKYRLSKKFKNQTKSKPEDRDFGDDDRYNY